MTNSPKKHIIDSLLREIYGEKSPPDQTEEILRRLEAKDQTLLSDSKIGRLDSDSGPVPVIDQDNPVAATTSPNWIVIAATVLFCIGLIGATIKVMQGRNANENVAQDETGQSSGNDQSKKLPANDKFAKKNVVPNKTDLANNQTQPKKPKDIRRPQPIGVDAVESNPLPTFAENAKPLPWSNIKSTIDQSLAENWHVHVIDQPTSISKAAWIDRVYQVLLGRDPEPADLESVANYLTGDSIPSRENQLRFIESIISNNETGREFTHRWADKFLGHLTRYSGRNQPADQTSLKLFLRESFVKKRSLNDIVHDLLTAEGAVNSKGKNVPGGYLAIVGRNSNTLTENVSRSLLGTELSCARCHTDSVYEQSQKDYLGLASFFQATKVTRKTNGDSVVSEATTKRKSPGLFFSDQNGLAVYAAPLIAGHDADLDQSGARKSLANQLVRSDRFAKAMVNWIWREIYGYGLAKEGRVSQYTNAPHQELLSILSEQLVANDFDFRTVVKWALLSESFSAAPTPSAETLTKDNPKYGGVAFFSYAYQAIENDPVESVKRLADAYAKPEGLSKVGRMSLNVKRTKKGIELIDGFEKGVLPNGLKVEDEIPDFAKGWGVESKVKSVLDRVAKSSELPLEQKIQHLYLLAVKRVPNKAELTKAKSLFEARKDADDQPVEPKPEYEVLQDLWWAIYPR